MREKINNYMYYIIIGIVSVLVMLVMPMMGSTVGLEIKFPDTVGGWIVYVGNAALTAIANMLLFFAFMSQGKVNIKNNDYYKEANEILLRLQIKHQAKTKLPRSPRKWQVKEYTRKGLMLFLGSIASCFALTNAVLMFDPVALISYAITVVFALIFGFFQMKTAEEY